MLRGFFVSTALAAGLMAAGSTFAAQAAPAVTAAFGQGIATNSIVQKAGWQCGPRRCNWVPNYWGVAPGFALGWGAPMRRNCYWKRGLLGNWKQKCDD